LGWFIREASMSRSAILGVVSFVLVLFVGGQAAAQQEQVKEAVAASARAFNFQPVAYISKEPGDSPSTVPVAINDSGIVVGSIVHQTSFHSPASCWNGGCGNEMFIWENGKLQPIRVTSRVPSASTIAGRFFSCRRTIRG
jgi:hypothetical protein